MSAFPSNALAQLKAPPPVQAKPENPSSPAQGKTFKSDQLSLRNPRDGSLELFAGVISANNLDQVVVQVAGKETRLDSKRVERITWGQVPASYTDARASFSRGQFGNSAAQFRLCAGDASARPVVRASARLRAAQSLLRWGASEPLHFAEASDEAQKFLAEFPSNREVPEARRIQARAQWMAGEIAKAAALYKSLYAEWKSDAPTAGYRREFCFEAGLNAARALCELKPPDAQGAREIYGSLAQAAGAALEKLEPTSAARPSLARLQDEAELGEGFADLAAGDATRAMTLFKDKAHARPGASDALRYGASLGLAQALQALGRFREAQIEFARVSALEHDDRDRAAAAQLGLAVTTIQLADPDALAQARGWLEAIARTQGDTLAARRARELLGKL